MHVVFLIFVDAISFTILPPKQRGVSQTSVTGGHALCLKYQLSHYNGSSSDTFEHSTLFYMTACYPSVNTLHTVLLSYVWNVRSSYNRQKVLKLAPKQDEQMSE